MVEIKINDGGKVVAIKGMCKAKDIKEGRMLEGLNDGS